mmetsp:Transcript_99153/g.196505  ORF Transcript_99153/g.196505 Transcript_99153/m.196505 type:complete len:147 (+) Transcript_99153:73-513(+)
MMPHERESKTFVILGPEARYLGKVMSTSRYRQSLCTLCGHHGFIGWSKPSLPTHLKELFWKRQEENWNGHCKAAVVTLEVGKTIRTLDRNSCAAQKVLAADVEIDTDAYLCYGCSQLVTDRPEKAEGWLNDLADGSCRERSRSPRR